MRKYNIGFLIWRINRGLYAVLANCTFTGQSIWLTVDLGGPVTPVSDDAPPPDIRLLVACEWRSISPIARAHIRAIVQARFERKAGLETIDKMLPDHRLRG